MNEFMAIKMHLHCSLPPVIPLETDGQGILEVDHAIRHAGSSIDEVLI
jgi:hypothetical protein